MKAFISGVVGLLIVLSAGCNDVEVAEESVVRPVRSTIVNYEVKQFALDLAGDVQARYISDLGFQVSGKLIKRYVEVGDLVKKGQLLAKIDDRDYLLQKEQATAQLTLAKANLQTASSELARFEKLLSQNLISSSQYDAQLNATNVAKAQVQEAQSSVNIAKNRMQYTKLHAVSQGVVTKISAEVGRVISAGQPLFEVARENIKEVAVEIPERLVQGIALKDKVDVSVWAIPGKMFPGVVREIAPKADTATRTYLAKISITKGEESIDMGMSARVHFQKDEGNLVVRLPLTAILLRENSPYVWVVDPNTSIVKLQPVKIVEQLNNEITIFDGVSNGDRIVTAGVHRLFEGQVVSLLEQ